MLFEELKLPTPRRSRKQLTEQHSTSEKVLLALKEHHPLPALILGALSPYQLQVEDLLTPPLTPTFMQSIGTAKS